MKSRCSPDTWGNIVPRSESDCSPAAQQAEGHRRNALPPFLSEDTRQRMFEAARAAVSAAIHECRNGRISLDGDGNFYFIEMNTRLQVEHAVSGRGLRNRYRQVADPHSFKASALLHSGRRCPARSLDRMPRQREITGADRFFLHLPSTTRVIFDSALVQGERISPLYDSMLGKLVVYAPTRDEGYPANRSFACRSCDPGRGNKHRRTAYHYFRGCLPIRGIRHLIPRKAL